MSNGLEKTFKKEFTNSDVGGQEKVQQEYQLNDLIDPKAMEQSTFTYASDQARNFDETNIKKARQGVTEILSDTINKAKTKAVQIREEARQLGHKEGYDEGFKKGKSDANQEFTPLFETFSNHIKTLSKFREKMFGKAEREMIELIVALTKKVIHHELSTREDSIQEMIRLAVKSVLDKENMVIKVNPADKDYAEAFRPELHKMFDEIKNIVFESTPALERGGCIIETNFGIIDARLEHMNEQIEKIINLTPIAFDEEKTEFSTKSSTEEEKTEASEETTPTEIIEDNSEVLSDGEKDDIDMKDIVDFDFPDFKSGTEPEPEN